MGTASRRTSCAMVILLAGGLVGCNEPSAGAPDSGRGRAAADAIHGDDSGVAYARPETGRYLPRAAAPLPKPLLLEDAKVSKTNFTSARVCGACHRNIYEKWSRSMHAQAFTDPVFQEALARAYYFSGGKAAEHCLGCHSPTTVRSKDYLGKNELTQEGVTCDFCHSLSELSEDAQSGGVSYKLDLTRKHGPFKDTDSPAHDVAYRDYFERSQICAMCHDYRTPEGVDVFATYAEWQASPQAAQGKHCQECHMPRLLGGTVAEQVKAVGHPVFNDHNLAGGHEPSQVKKAVQTQIQSVARDGDRVRVIVTLENSGAGHMVPTGLPSRKLVLSIAGSQRGVPRFRDERVYQRVMQGELMRPLVLDWEIKWLSKRLLRDNRIRPGEVRHETFVFNASRSEDVIVSVGLYYRYEPRVATEQLMEIPLAEIEHIVGRGL